VLRKFEEVKRFMDNMISNSVDNYIEYSHHIYKILPVIKSHLQDKFEIYLFISGKVNFFVEKNVYNLRYGDLIIVNSNEIHKASFLANDIYERIVITFDPHVIKLLNFNCLDLLQCFTNRKKGESNKINLNNLQIEEALNLFSKFEKINNENSDYAKILKLTCFIELLVFINENFNKPKDIVEPHNISKELFTIMNFINNNLGEDLTLQNLESKFYISKYYLSKLFKKETGINLHEYITLKRISKAKLLLSEGYNITEVCHISGFNDYANFIRLFKKYVGVPPGKYKQL